MGKIGMLRNGNERERRGRKRNKRKGKGRKGQNWVERERKKKWKGVNQCPFEFQQSVCPSEDWFTAHRRFRKEFFVILYDLQGLSLMRYRPALFQSD